MAIFKKSVIIFSVLASVTATGARPVATEKWRAGLSEITQNYANAVSYVPSAERDGQSTALNCMGQVYLEWAEAFLLLLDKLPADLGADDLKEQLKPFGMYYFSIKQNLPVYDYARHNLSKAVADELAAERSAKGLTSVVSKTFTLEDFQENLLQQNLKLCFSPDFIQGVAKSVPVGDGNKQIPPDVLGPDSFTVNWVRTANGGIKPIKIVDSDAEGKKATIHAKKFQDFLDDERGQ